MACPRGGGLCCAVARASQPSVEGRLLSEGLGVTRGRRAAGRARVVLVRCTKWRTAATRGGSWYIAYVHQVAASPGYSCSAYSLASACELCSELKMMAPRSFSPSNCTFGSSGKLQMMTCTSAGPAKSSPHVAAQAPERTCLASMSEKSSTQAPSSGFKRTGMGAGIGVV